MLTQLFTGADLSARLLAVAPFRQQFQQVLDGSPTPISIEQVRAFQKALALLPTTTENQYHLILEAQTLTLPAQQALLKLLEEPPANTQIILAADKPSSLLPTILSRCQLTKLKSPDLNDEALANFFLKHIATDNYSSLITYATTLKDDPTALTATITKLRSSLQTSPNLNRTRALTLLNNAVSDLKTNINQELALQHLLFSLKKLTQK